MYVPVCDGECIPEYACVRRSTFKRCMYEWRLEPDDKTMIPKSQEDIELMERK